MTHSAHKAPFSKIYAANEWTNGSGPGSHPAACRPLTTFLDGFIQANRISSIVDFGCGDWQFMSGVNRGAATYHGFDVVDSVLETNRARFQIPQVTFSHTPNDLGELPPADLLMLKDVLIHLPNSYIFQAADQFGKYKYILAINNVTPNEEEYNTEIDFGGFRPVDLSRAPFNQDCATVLRYGQVRMLDPRLPSPVAAVLRRFIWPGEKHVQLIVRSAGERRPA